MRLHTCLSRADVFACQTTPDVYLDAMEYGSRSHNHAFEVSLTGYGARHTRAKNTGTRGAGDDYERAATWSDWGRFLAGVFERDPSAKCADAYANSGDFDAKTHCLFAPGAAVTPAGLARQVRHELATVDYATKAGTIERVARGHGLPEYVVRSAIFGE